MTCRKCRDEYVPCDTVVCICVKGEIHEGEYCYPCWRKLFTGAESEKLACGCDDVFNPHEMAYWARWFDLEGDWIKSW